MTALADTVAAVHLLYVLFVIGGLGLVWAIPSVVLGTALILLNASTFPWPPGDRGLIDIGPFIGVFVMALAARLALLGKRAGS